MCSLKLAPSSFHFFGLMKIALNGHMFTLGSIVQVALVQQFRQQPNNFFGEGIHILLYQWDHCLNVCEFFFLLKYLHLVCPRMGVTCTCLT